MVEAEFSRDFSQAFVLKMNTICTDLDNVDMNLDIERSAYWQVVSESQLWTLPLVTSLLSPSCHCAASCTICCLSIVTDRIIVIILLQPINAEISLKKCSRF